MSALREILWLIMCRESKEIATFVPAKYDPKDWKLLYYTIVKLNFTFLGVKIGVKDHGKGNYLQQLIWHPKVLKWLENTSRLSRRKESSVNYILDTDWLMHKSHSLLCGLMHASARHVGTYYSPIGEFSHRLCIVGFDWLLMVAL